MDWTTIITSALTFIAGGGIMLSISIYTPWIHSVRCSSSVPNQQFGHKSRSSFPFRIQKRTMLCIDYLKYIVLSVLVHFSVVFERLFRPSVFSQSHNSDYRYHHTTRDFPPRYYACFRLYGLSYYTSPDEGWEEMLMQQGDGHNEIRFSYLSAILRFHIQDTYYAMGIKSSP